MEVFAGNRPFFPVIYAPYRCADLPYDDLGFDDFPNRAGWVFLDRPKDPDDPMREAFILRKMDGHADRSVDEKGSFLQSWLFFGALTDTFKTCGINLSVSDFLTAQDGSTVVSTVLLHQYGQRCVTQEAEMGLEGRQLRIRTIFNIICESEYFLSHWSPEGIYDKPGTNDDCATGRFKPRSINDDVSDQLPWGEQKRSIHQIFFSAAVVSRFIRLLAAQMFPEESRRINSLVSSPGEYLLGWAHGVDDHSVAGFMRPKGQCPSEAQLFLETLFGPPKIFVNFLPRLSLQQNHDKCTKYSCKAADVVKGTYKTRHTSNDCRCNIISVQGKKLADCLQNGKIPRLRIENQGPSENKGSMSVSVNDSEPFIAISHVWSHGLGNETANGLPACQLRRLQGYLTKLADTLSLASLPNLWIDTMCIPVGPKFRPWRRQAIEWLPRTFDEAEHILVLDEEIYTVSLQSSMLELGLRIFCSTWGRRLWTMAEGVRAVQSRVDKTIINFLAKENYNSTRISFQFLDGSMHFSYLAQISARSQLDVRDYFCCQRLWDALETRLPSFREAKDLPWISARLMEVTGALKFRTTTRDVDEATCIALLLGLPTLSITRHDRAPERMRELFLMIKDYPPDIIFYTFHPPLRNELEAGTLAAPQTEDRGQSAKRMSRSNLEICGFRWAPRSFLEHYPGFGPASWVVGQPTARCDSTGLHHTYDGFVFDIQTDHTPTQAGSQQFVQHQWSGISRSMRLVLNDENGRRKHKCLEILRYDDEPEEISIGPSATSSMHSRGAVVFQDIDGRGRAILGRVHLSHSVSWSEALATRDLRSRRHAEDDLELVFQPLARCSVVSSSFIFPSWYYSEDQTYLMVHGQYASAKWCIT